MNVLDLKIGTKKRKVKVNEIRQIDIDVNGKPATKVVFDVIDECTGNEFQISDAWISTNKAFQIKGMWLTLQNDKKEISTASTLAEVLNYYKVDSLKELVSKEVLVYPDPQNFLVLVACELPENF